MLGARVFARAGLLSRFQGRMKTGEAEGNTGRGGAALVAK
jgi:hypothetical protein